MGRRPRKLTKGALLLQDNASVNQSYVIMLTIRLLAHPLYSLDLSPSDNHVSTSGTMFEGSEIFFQTRCWRLGSQSKIKPFLKGLEALQVRYHKCVQLRGKHGEQLSTLTFKFCLLL